MEEDVKIKGLHDKLKELDEAIKKEGVTRSIEWFGRHRPKKVSYSPLVKEVNKSEKTVSRIIIKIPVTNFRKISTECYDHEGKKFDNIEELQVMGSKVKATLEFNFLWFCDTKYGISCKLKKLEIVTKSEKFIDWWYDMNDDEESTSYEEDTTCQCYIPLAVIFMIAGVICAKYLM